MSYKDRIIKNLINLLRAKAIISLVVAFVFLVKIISGAEIGGYFMTVFTVVVTYWLCDRRSEKEGE